MPQTNIFEMLREPYRLPKRPKLFEAFAGVGCQHMAFNRLGIEVDMVGISEIDQAAIRSYMAIHGETKNWGSICDVHGKDLPQIDVLTYSFPCTDLSKAGTQRGLVNTRSGLVYEVLRILHELDAEHRLPKVLIMENVVDLVQVKFINQFNKIQFELEQLGYSNYTEVMNAKDFGVAQNRDRVFMVSILGDYYYEFPKPFPLVKRLKDYLETGVDEKYYISKKMYDGMTKTSFNSYKLENKIQDGDGYVSTLLARYEGSPQLVDEEQCFGSKPNAKEELCEKMLATGELKEGDMIRHSYTKHRMAFENARTENSDNVSSCLTTRPDTLGVVVSSMIDDDGNVRRYLDSPIVDQFNVGDCADISFPNGYNKGKRVYDGYAPALNLTTTKDNFVVKQPDLRIRKLTPRECWRLMGIDDQDFDKASQVTKSSQLYKQAGNGIVVDVFAAILKQMMEQKC